MSHTLLLADDSITIQRVIELTFADEDVRVLVASDGQQAIQRIDSDRPDIVLADIGMPRVDGYAVATHVKQSASLQHIPVLLLTGAFEPIDEARARMTGCDGVLVKPFEPQKLVARVKELLSGARGAEMWPADMPRTQVAPAPPVPVRTPQEEAEPAGLPVLLRETQQQVAAPPLSVPVQQSDAEIDRAYEPATDSVFDLSEVVDGPATPAPMLEGDQVANRFGDQGHRQARTELPPPADRLETELDMLDAALSRLDPTAHPHELDAATASDFARDLNEMRNEARQEDAQATRPARPTFGTWDLPKPGESDVIRDEPVDLVAEEIPLVQPTPLAYADAPAETPAVPLAQSAPIVQAPVVHAPVVQTPVVQAPMSHAPVVQIRAPEAQPVVQGMVPAPVVHIPVAVIRASAEPSALPGVTAYAAAPADKPASRSAERPSLASAFSALLAAEKSHPAAQAAAPQISEAAIEDVVRRVLARMAGDTVSRVVLETAERLIREEISRTKDSPGR